MLFKNESPLANYFPLQDAIVQVDSSTQEVTNSNSARDKMKQIYEFLPYHPVCATSEMVGTSIEELLMHNFPTKKSWENSRLGDYPQEVVCRLNYRSHMKYVLIRAKINRPIPSLDIYIADGIYGNFNDTEYRKVGSVRNITEEGETVKVDGIGNYLKLVFTKGNYKTQDNPFGQVSLSQLKIFGKKINHLIYYNELDDHTGGKNQQVDKILIEMGLPLEDPYYLVNDQNYEIAPVDEETKITIKDMLLILRRAETSKDYEIMKKIKKDIKTVFYIGNEILNCERQLTIAKSKDDYDTCIKLRKRLEDLRKRRDNFDAIYETSRYEKMIVMKRPTTADLLWDEENRLRLERERLERERLERERLERERRQRELEEKQGKEKNDNFDNKKLKPEKRVKFVEYVNQKEKEKKEEFLDELQYNQGDKDLEPYFVPRARQAGGNIPTPDINKLRKALRDGILTVTGVRLYSALIGNDWKMREAAVRAFLEFIENPLIPRYFNKTLPLFLACIEVSKFACDDKVIQIYLEGLKILATCLAPPICGNDIDPNLIQKSIQYFIPKFIKKISEFNDKQRDLTLKTLIDIFRHPALNVGDLVKCCLDIIEQQDGVTPDKQPWNVLLTRLEIILRVLDEFGIDETLWDWYNVFIELIIPSLFHQKPDCRLVAEEICIILYKFVGNDIKIIINDLNNLKPSLKEKLNARMNEIDISIKRETAPKKENDKQEILDPIYEPEADNDA